MGDSDGAAAKRRADGHVGRRGCRRNGTRNRASASCARCAVQNGRPHERTIARVHGPPAAKAAEGATEVWSYNSGNDHTTIAGFGQSVTNASATGGRGYASGTAFTTGSNVGISSRRYCTVNVVMSGGRVSRINYSGPTGGLLSAGEQCAYAVQNCAN